MFVFWSLSVVLAFKCSALSKNKAEIKDLLAFKKPVLVPMKWFGAVCTDSVCAPSSAASKEYTRPKCFNQSCELPEWTETLVSTKYLPRLWDDTLHSVTLFCSTVTPKKNKKRYWKQLPVFVKASILLHLLNPLAWWQHRAAISNVTEQRSGYHDIVHSIFLFSLL